MSEEERAFYDTERKLAIQLLEQIPDQQLAYVIGYLEGACIPETPDPFPMQKEWFDLTSDT